MSDFIKIEECVNGCLYRISSRNLVVGVFRADVKGFIGIREKFGDEYLFTEYHWDNGPPFGTVMPKEFLEGCPLADLRESIGSFDSVTNREVAFDKPIANGGKGWYYLDTGEASEAIRPVSRGNQELFDWLKEKEAQYSK
jgi:hypothetical protein